MGKKPSHATIPFTMSQKGWLAQHIVAEYDGSLIELSHVYTRL